MAGSEIRNGRKYLIFDDPKVQEFYDVLFQMGNPNSYVSFDVNSAADLAKIGIIDPAAPAEETAFFPMRFDMDKIDREQKVATVVDGYNRSEFIEVLNYYTPEEKQAHEQLKSTDPERWAEERSQKEAFACEGFLRRNIRRMMEGHMVLMDEKKTEYPRSLRIETGKSGSLSFHVEDVPAAPAEAPEEPEKPSFYGILSFFYNIFGWGKGVVEPYRQSMEEYRKAYAEWHDKDTERRVSEKVWPEYAAQGKKIAPPTPDPIKVARFRVESVADAVRISQKNLTSVFGPDPHMRPGMKRDFAPVIETIDPAQAAKPVNGITAEQSAAFTHLAMMGTEISKDFMQSTTFFKSCPDHPAAEDRGIQLFSASAHMWDLQMGRDGMLLFSKDHPNGSIVAQAHKTAQKAYAQWVGEKHDPSLMGKVLADGLVVFAHTLCRNDAGVSQSYASTMQECENIYTMMTNFPELREAAVKEGLTEDVLNIMEANHQMTQLLHTGADAQRKLLSGKSISEEEKRELLTDALLMEYTGNMLIEEQKKVENRVMGNLDALQQPLIDLQKRNDAEVAALKKQIKNAQTPEEKAALEAQKQALEDKHANMMTVEGSLTTERLGADQFVEAASQRYLAMGDPAKIAQVRETIKNSRAVKMFADMPQKECVDTLAEIIGKDNSPVYKRLHVELAAAIDKKILDAPVHSAAQQPVPAAAKQVQKQQQPVVPGAKI